MPRLILKCRYITNQKRHLENLIRYIATRDGAEPVKSTKGYLPASGKQKMVISEIIREMPESRDLYEYNDYKKHPTIEKCFGVHYHSTGTKSGSDRKKEKLRRLYCPSARSRETWSAWAFYGCRDTDCSV